MTNAAIQICSGAFGSMKFTAEIIPSLRKPMTEASVAPGASRRARVPKATTKGGETKSMQKAETKRRLMVDGWSRSCRNDLPSDDDDEEEEDDDVCQGSDQM